MHIQTYIDRLLAVDGVCMSMYNMCVRLRFFRVVANKKISGQFFGIILCSSGRSHRIIYYHKIHTHSNVLCKRSRAARKGFYPLAYRSCETVGK